MMGTFLIESLAACMHAVIYGEGILQAQSIGVCVTKWVSGVWFKRLSGPVAYKAIVVITSCGCGPHTNLLFRMCIGFAIRLPKLPNLTTFA